jgi:AraC-like DNA-binding protein
MLKPNAPSELSRVPYEKIDSRNQPKESGEAAGRRLIETTYDLEIPESCTDWAFLGEVWRVGSLTFARFEAPQHTLTRGPRHILQNPGRYLKLQLFEQDEGWFEGADGRFEVAVGVMCVIDQSRPYVQRMPSGRHLSVFVPHAAVGYDPAASPPFIGLRPADFQGRILGRTLVNLFDALPDLRQDEAALVEAILVSTCQHVLKPAASEPTTGRIRSDRKRRIEKIIEQNLNDPELGVESIMASIAVSRATLFRQFEVHGGVASYIRKRRLHRAFGLIAGSGRHRGAVRSAWQACGFRNDADFSRAFKKEFGHAPSEVLGLWLSLSARDPGSAGSGENASKGIAGTSFIG